MAMEMRGALNLSKYYKPGSNQPRFYGRVLINGKTYNLKGWEKSGPEGPWISLMVEDPEGDNGFSDPTQKADSLFSSEQAKPKVNQAKKNYEPTAYELEMGDVPF